MLDPGRFAELKDSGNLPSPKGPALKVIQLCQRDNAPLPEITRVLQIDPAMVGRILKLANSAAFNRQRPAAALTPDILMSIGIQAVRQVVLAFSLVSGNRNGPCPGFDYQVFWSRSAATGVATQLLSAATRAAPPADLFTVGLLANVGRMALAALHPARYGELLVQAGGQFSRALTALEGAAFGYTHLEIAAAMMKDWGLPKLFADAVLFHEAPALSEFDPSSRSAKLVNCVHLGARMADLCFMQESMRAAEFRQLALLASALGIAEGSFTALCDQMLLEWAEWGALLEIPVHEVAAFSTLLPAPSDAAGTDPAALKQLRILIVDDDQTVCLLLQKLLTAAGHSVHVARDGREGLEQALQQQPQLVIADLFMAHHGGLQFIKALRQTEPGQSIYIIALSIPDDEDKLTQALQLGADDYITKPVEGKQLQARLNVGMRIIGRQQALQQERDALRRR